MPAWLYVVAVAAVLFVAWFAFARRWVHAVWYSWTRARHLADLTETEVIPGAEYIPYVEVAGSPPWPLDWREQTRVELAPETLDSEERAWEDLAASRAALSDLIPDPRLAAPVDPGPGGDARLSTTPPPGPDQPTPLQAQMAAVLRRPEPSRLADAGDVTAAHVAYPSPDWLACQMADLFDWVRGMVPQVTGWSVGA